MVCFLLNYISFKTAKEIHASYVICTRVMAVPFIFQRHRTTPNPTKYVLLRRFLSALDGFVIVVRLMFLVLIIGRNLNGNEWRLLLGSRHEVGAANGAGGV